MTMDLIEKITAIGNTHRTARVALAAYVFHSDGQIRNAHEKDLAFEEQVKNAQNSGTGDKVLVPFSNGDDIIEVTPRVHEAMKQALVELLAEAEQFPSLMYEMAFIYRVALYDAFLDDTL